MKKTLWLVACLFFAFTSVVLAEDTAIYSLTKQDFYDMKARLAEAQQEMYDARANARADYTEANKQTYIDAKAAYMSLYTQYSDMKAKYAESKASQEVTSTSQDSNSSQTESTQTSSSQQITDGSQTETETEQANSTSSQSWGSADYEQAKQELIEARAAALEDGSKEAIENYNAMVLEFMQTQATEQNVTETRAENTTVEETEETNIEETVLSEAPLTCKKSEFGMNLVEDIYFSPEMIFRDLAKVSLPMKRFDGVEPLPSEVDENGYFLQQPNSKVYAYLTQMKWSSSTDPVDYVLLYDGSAKISFFPLKPEIISSEEGRIHFRLNSTGTLKLQIEKISSSDYLRNIRIIPLEDENNPNAPMVSSRFKEVWSGFGTYRYLDPMRINGSKESSWSERTKPDHFGRDSSNGMSIEDIVSVSNETQTNPWVLIPHLATDDYIRNMAKYLKDNLDSNLSVYVEYTNEPWNYGFSQSQWLLEKAGGDFKKQPYEYGLRAKNALATFSSVFTDSSRLIRVFNAQFWNTGYLGNAIDQVPNLMDGFDAIGLGYYIGAHLETHMGDVSLLSDDDVIDYLADTIDGVATERLNHYRELADEYDVQMVAYEAGQHLVGGRDSYLVDRYKAINENPRMKDVYLKMADAWSAAGGDLLVWFNSAWNVFGTLESQGQDLSTAPKYQAMKEYLSRSGC